MASVPHVETPAKARTLRRFARHRVEALMYVDLGPDNGGFSINISEDGMAFQGIRPLENNQEICVTFKLDGIDEAVTATAKIVWLTESRKAGALQFIDFPEASRRAVSDWIALQKQADAARHDAAARTSQVKAMGSLLDSVKPAPNPRHSASPTHIATIVAKPLADPSPSTGEPVRTGASNAIPAAELNVTKSLPLKQPRSSADLAQPPRVPALPAKVDRKSRWSSAAGFKVAACIAVLTFGGVILWPSRAILLHRFDRSLLAHTDADFDSAQAAALPVEQTAVVESSGNSAVSESSNESSNAASNQSAANESSQAASLAVEQEDPAIPSPPIVATNVSSVPVRNSTPVVPEMNHERSSQLPILSATELRPRKLPIAPAKSELSATVPPDSVLEAKNEPPVAVTPASKITPPEPKPRSIPVIPAGTIEIVSDPYPSIRMPAPASGPSSRLGTTLQIGRLASKVDPQYPPEALQQRIAGTVKVHVVISQTGAIETAELVDGPRLLADAVLRAVQQWRYEPTLLGSAAIEVEEDITAVFKIANPASPAN